MGSQLVLMDNCAVDWRLDDRTREIGRRGLAAAREALAEAIQRGGGAGDPAQAADRSRPSLALSSAQAA
jgi:hypothetical protein